MEKPITICLGVLCDNAKKVVVAADRMLTGADVEFEQDSQKVQKVTETCVVLTAGSALEQVDLLNDVCGELCTQRSPSVYDVVRTIKIRWVNARKQKAEELHLKPLGLDLEQFMQNQNRYAESLSLRLIHNIEREGLDLELLVAGVDSTGAHLYYITDPGTADCFDAIAFCAIGSGERHAELCFIRSGYSPTASLNKAVFMAYQAKRDSEVAPGVGSRYTDIVVIDDTNIQHVHQDTLATLSQSYDELMVIHNKTHANIQARIDALQLNWKS